MKDTESERGTEEDWWLGEMEAEKYQKRGVVVFAPTQNYSSWEKMGRRGREGEREDMRATDENGGCR